MENTLVETKVKNGFMPDAMARKLFKGYSFDVCSYIYPDGILTIEHKHIKQGKYQAEIEVYHVWHCHIDMVLSNYHDNSAAKISRIVCHDSKVLLDGVLKIEYYSNNTSQKMVNMGITMDTMNFITPSGAEHSTDITEWHSGSFTVQWDSDTLADVVERNKANVEIHS